MALYFRDIPAGRYALQHSKTGRVRFFQVDQPAEGSKWGDFTFIKALSGAPGDFRKTLIRGQEADMFLWAIKADPLAAMTFFGKETKHCGKCGASLSDEVSRERGFGPDCAKALGLDKPKQEAMLV